MLESKDNIKPLPPKPNRAQELYMAKQAEKNKNEFDTAKTHAILRDLQNGNSKIDHDRRSAELSKTIVSGLHSTVGTTMENVNKNISKNNLLLEKILKIQEVDLKDRKATEKRLQSERNRDSSSFSFSRTLRDKLPSSSKESGGDSGGILGKILGMLGFGSIGGILAALGLGGAGLAFGSGDISDRLKQVSSIVRGVFGLVSTMGKYTFEIFKMFEKIPGIGKIASKIPIMGKIGAHLGLKGAAAVLKKIPGIGAIAGLLFGIKRFSDGDTVGGIGEIASGIASLVPGYGTAISMALDAALIFRDLKTEADTPEAEAANRKAFDKKLLYTIPGISSFMYIKDGIDLWNTDKSEALKKFAMAGLAGTPLGPIIGLYQNFIKDDGADPATIKAAPAKPKQSNKMFGFDAGRSIRNAFGMGDYDSDLGPTPDNGNKNDSTDIQTALVSVASSLGVSPQALDKLITHETGGSWNPKQRTGGDSSAKGLIQFIDSTAQGLGYNNAQDLVDKNSTVTGQLTGPVYEYLKRLAPFSDDGDMFLSVFNPASRRADRNSQFSEKIQKANNYSVLTPQDYINQVSGKSPMFMEDGGMLTGSRPVVAGEAGPEAFIPLNRDGIQFMADAINRVISTGAGNSQSSNTIVDNMKTYFSGEFIDKFIAKLSASRSTGSGSSSTPSFAMF